MVAHRRSVLAVWLVLLVLGGWATSDLGSLLTNRFSVPGSDAERGLNILHDALQRARRRRASRSSCARPAAARRRCAGRRGGRAARRRGTSPAARRGPRAIAGPGLVYVQIATPLQAADAKNYTEQMRAGDRHRAGRPHVPHRLPGAQPRRPAASTAATSARARRSRCRSRSSCCCSCSARSAPSSCRSSFALRDAAHDARARVGDRAPREHGRIRDEHRHPDRAGDRDRLLDARRLPLPRAARRAATIRATALETTMATAGRATLFSGLTVAIGLALLLLMPLPFMRSMGAGAVLIPLVSIAASATFLPALLSRARARASTASAWCRKARAGAARERRAGDVVAAGAHDHAPPGLLPRGRRRAAARARDARARSCT